MPEYLSGKMETLIWKYTCTPNIRSSTIYNSQDMETTQMAISGWLA